MFLICQILDTQSSLFCFGYALAGCAIVCPFAVRSSRPRRGAVCHDNGHYKQRQGSFISPFDRISKLGINHISILVSGALGIRQNLPFFTLLFFAIRKSGLPSFGVLRCSRQLSSLRTCGSCPAPLPPLRLHVFRKPISPA